MMDTLKEVIKRLNKLENDPAVFMGKHGASNNKTLKVIKQCYSLLSSRKNISDSDKNDNSLNELFTEGFDDEQIWQQIELKINSISNCVPQIARLCVSEEDLIFPFLNPKQINPTANDKENETELDNSLNLSQELSQEESGDESDEESEDDLSDKELPLPKTGDKSKKEMHKENKNAPKSVVDDEFFKLSEMEKYLDKMEKESLSDDDINYFEDIPSDPETNLKEAKYDDFFRNPDSDYEGNENNDMPDDEMGEEDDESEDSDEESEMPKKKVRFSQNAGDDDGSSDSEDSSKEKTSFEIRDAKLKQKIAKLEESNLSEKPWAHKGEVDASSRPVNSLLEEVLDVDLTVRPPPVITEKVTLTLEQIIINRIKDAAYDDVERKIKPVHVPHELKKELVLNQEKSKFSLAEIYEQEFLKRKPTTESTEESDKLSKEKEKILKMMKSVFHKLDTLSNFHYTPKPVSADLEIVSNLPAITMEEATPVAVSDANLLAPQEIGDQAKRKLLGKDERTKTDKRRERRKKKAFLSHKFKNANKGKQLSTTLKSRNVSLALPTAESNVKSSSSFFKKLQEDTESGVKVRKKVKTPKK